MMEVIEKGAADISIYLILILIFLILIYFIVQSRGTILVNYAAYYVYNETI